MSTFPTTTTTRTVPKVYDTTDYPSSKSLKRLGFVQSGTTYAYGVTGQVQKLYTSAKSLTPNFAAPTVDKIEDTVVAYTAPVAAQAQDTGDKLLRFADDKVDYVINTGSNALSSGKSSVNYGINSVQELHANNVKTFSSASEKYFDLLSRTADWVADKLNPVKGVRAARDLLKAAIYKAQEAADPDVAYGILSDAWAKFASIGPVATVLEGLDPVTKLGLHTFYVAHDKVVSWPLYKTGVDLGNNLLQFGLHSYPYKLYAHYLYPIIQPLADPTVYKFKNSRVINNTLSYWTPTYKYPEFSN